MSGVGLANSSTWLPTLACQAGNLVLIFLTGNRLIEQDHVTAVMLQHETSLLRCACFPCFPIQERDVQKQLGESVCFRRCRHNQDVPTFGLACFHLCRHTIPGVCCVGVGYHDCAFRFLGDGFEFPTATITRSGPHNRETFSPCESFCSFPTLRNRYSRQIEAFGKNGVWLRVFEVPVPIFSERFKVP